MSMNYYTYVGPYLAVRVVKEVEQHYGVVSCGNAECKRHGDVYESHQAQFHQKFCPDCGSVHVKTARMRMVPVRLHAVFSELKMVDVFHHVSAEDGGWDVLLWNRKADFGHEVGSKEGVIPFKAFDCGTDIGVFETVAKDHIAKLERYFSKENVEVKWGVVTYSM